jgi:hypothetical protein
MKYTTVHDEQEDVMTHAQTSLNVYLKYIRQCYKGVWNIGVFSV